MLGEDSDNSESDDESSDADFEEADVKEINSILSDQMPSPEDSSSDEDNELDDSSSTGEHFERKGERWNPLLSNKTVQTRASNLVRVKSGVNTAIRRQAGSTPYECWKLFVDRKMLKNIQATTTRKAKESNPNLDGTREVRSFYKFAVRQRNIRKNPPSTFSLKQNLWSKNFP